MIATHPGVRQVLVVPVDDAEFGQRPVAVVECDDGTDISQLAGWVADKLARFQQPVHWLALPEALKNGGIKISRRALQQWVNAPAEGLTRRADNRAGSLFAACYLAGVKVTLSSSASCGLPHSGHTDAGPQAQPVRTPETLH